MELTATDFRKHLFRTLERALEGESVEIVYKGARLRLSPPTNSKLARAVQRPTLLVPPESIVESDFELMAELQANWQKGDRQL